MRRNSSGLMLTSATCEVSCSSLRYVQAVWSGTSNYLPPTFLRWYKYLHEVVTSVILRLQPNESDMTRNCGQLGECRVRSMLWGPQNARRARISQGCPGRRWKRQDTIIAVWKSQLIFLSDGIMGVSLHRDMFSILYVRVPRYVLPRLCQVLQLTNVH